MNAHKKAVKAAFGAVLRDARKRRLLSQEALAAKAGVERTYISLLERGGRSPTLVTLWGLAKGCAVKPSVLIRRTAQKLRQQGR